MSLSREKFPIVLTVIENLGFSSSWTGNAVASANPTNLYSMWERYPHTVLFPETDNKTLSYENNEVDLARLFCGRHVAGDKDYIDKMLIDDKLTENKVFSGLLDETLERNSALHLIGNIPSPGNEYCNEKQLFSILREAKNKKLFRVYLHLIIDDGLKETPVEIDKFLAKINQIGACEVASVAGQNYLDDQNKNARTFSQGVLAIVNGSGKAALSAQQALSLKGVPSPSEKQPTSVSFRNHFNCKFGNFDTVLFFNHNNKSLTRLILALSSPGRSFNRIKLPRFLKVATLVDPFPQEVDQVEIVFRRSTENSIAEALATAGVDSLFISDTTRISTVNKHLIGKIEGSKGTVKNLFVPVVKGSDPENYNQVLDLILRQLSHHLEQKTAEFFVILIPILSEIEDSSFSKIVATIKLIDKFLPKLESEVAKHNGSLVITSDHGGSEKLSERDDFETLNSKTKNPVPFILTVPGYIGELKGKKDVVFNQILYDMIRKRHFINDAVPTILDVSGIEPLSEMTGKSFLSDLKIKIE